VSTLRKLRRWCPQPSKPILTNSTRLSSPVIAAALIVEIVALLIVPMAYYALLVPKPEVALYQTFPLTDSQIRAAWPNLPSAQEIVNNGQYAFYNTKDYIVGSNSTANKIYLQTPPHWWDNSSVTIVIQNETETNIPNMLRGGIIPVGYHIYLQLNSTMWIEVPQTYLSTTHLPTIPSVAGFLGTGLPIEYVIIAAIVIVASLIVGTTYLRLNKKKAYS
jgi:hypothetical protein